jgi:hypothetical protein
MKNKTVVILLVWQRVQTLEKSLNMLSKQTNQNFDIHVSNGNLDLSENVERIVKNFKSKNISIKLSHDGNEHYTFRRFFIAKEYAKSGYDVVFLLDDDININEKYIEHMLSIYEPNKYFSCYAWNFNDSPKNYWKDRTRIEGSLENVDYGGAGVSMVDSSIFLKEELFNVIDPMAYRIDDLWISYVCNSVIGWPVVSANTKNISIGGGDGVALYKKLKANGQDQKSIFLSMLINKGKWKL